MWRITSPSSRLKKLKIRESLPRYVDIVMERAQAKYLLAKRAPVDFDSDGATKVLWAIHDEAIDNILIGKEIVNSSLSDLKLELGRRIMSDCHFCERRCGINRLEDEKGYCKCSETFAYSSGFPHMGEEPELIPSGTVFTCGCTIRCIHCQNWEISQWYEKGTSLTPEGMISIVRHLKEQGSINLNMVGGDPTPNCWLWMKTLFQTDLNIPTVWNSNSYYSLETAKLLAEYIDLYLLDFKYGNNECAEQISDAPGYMEACTRNHLYAKKYGELIIRILVLPGHNNCCTKPILQWIYDNLGPLTRVNLMFQYHPAWKSNQRPELRRRLNNSEINEALKIVKEIGLLNMV